MVDMKISAKMITYGRVEFLMEALHCFLLQENSENDELIIVNDYPLQTLVFDHPRVKIYNLKETFPLIGDKENYAIERCSGDIISVFDDDDLYMPNHFNNIRKFWKEDTNILHWKKGIYYNYPDITSIEFIGNSGIAYSKKAWEAIGKSPICGAGGDTLLVNSIHSLDRSKVVFAEPSNEEISSWYRWALPQYGGVYHQSGQSFDTPDRLSVVQRNAQHIEILRLKGIIPTGEIKLNPHWNDDYIGMLSSFVKNIK